MDLNPQRVRNAEFKTVKRGLDPEEVRRFLGDVADELEGAQNQSTAMEARARAAVARLQELSDGAESQAAAASTDEPSVASVEQAETISRTLLLAQRTADTTIAQAEAESDRLVGAANEEAAATLDSTREMAAHLMEEARDEARKVGEAERLAVASEVSSLKARRDFLESDVDHLEQFLIAQRERLREAAGAMIELTERVPNGLGEVRRPLLSAADDGDVDHEVADADADAGSAVLDDAEEPSAGADEAVGGVGGEAVGDIGDIGEGDVAAVEGVGDDGGAADPDAAGEPDDLVIVTDVADLPPDDAPRPVDPTPRSFGVADASADIDRPDDADMRFTFDDRT